MEINILQLLKKDYYLNSMFYLKKIIVHRYTIKSKIMAISYTLNMFHLFHRKAPHFIVSPSKKPDQKF